MARKAKKFDTSQVLNGFSVSQNDPLTEQYALLLQLVKENDQVERGSYHYMKLKDFKLGPELATLSKDEQVSLIEAILRQLIRIDRIVREFRGDDIYAEFDRHDWNIIWGPRSILFVVLKVLLRKKLPFAAEQIALMADWVSEAKNVSTFPYPLSSIVKCVENLNAETPLHDDVRSRVEKMRQVIQTGDNEYDIMKLAERLKSVLSAGPVIPLEPGEAWSDVAIADIENMNTPSWTAWVELLQHCQKASGGKPTKKWLKTVEPLIAGIGEQQLSEHLTRWFPLVDKPRTDVIDSWSQWVPNPNLMIIDLHADILKGLAWCCGLFENSELARSLTTLAISAYRKVPGVGPRAVKVGNACVYALGAMPGMDGVGQLALLKVRVKFGTAQKGIEKALVATAERVGIPRDELEEMSVPAYGLTTVGLRTETLGEFEARLVVAGRKPELQWFKTDGKQQKTVPKRVKEDFGDDLKELKQAAKDIEKMLPAQSARIEQTYLDQREWELQVWQERYLDHPLVGTLARRLIWSFQSGRKKASAIWTEAGFVDSGNKPVAWINEQKPKNKIIVRLWHPLDEKKTEGITAWRDWLVEHEVQQPFKQAHREVYILTDAERNTEIYSNRFAAHVLKQHQFNALCGARNWKNTLRLAVDDQFPPAHIVLPTWNLRAEFWIEGAGEEYGVDTNEAGTFLYLTTDQVRFYSSDAANNWAHAGGGGYTSEGMEREENIPLSLDQIPPLVFSEVMRDVDLFVGVASVGNDPNWNDGGPEGRYRDYWASYSFGELSATAGTRKAVLERLIPRLRIADQCSFSERFLIVKGEIRTYKIHLGSGNILMEPNDQYLCIVPKQTTAKAGEPMFLPFEGDNTMSIILSKALLLADDKKIKDSTIVSQITQ